MALPTVSCFKGLDWLDQIAAIYEALYDEADDPDLTPPECFKGQDFRDQLTDIYAAFLVIGSIPPGVFTYLQPEPDSEFTYIQPDGVSQYMQP